MGAIVMACGTCHKRDANDRRCHAGPPTAIEGAQSEEGLRILSEWPLVPDDGYCWAYAEKVKPKEAMDGHGLPGQ